MQFIFGLYSISAKVEFKSDCTAAQTESICYCFHCGISVFNQNLWVKQWRFRSGCTCARSDYWISCPCPSVKTIYILTVCMRVARAIAIMTTKTSLYMHYVTHLWSVNLGIVNSPDVVFMLLIDVID